MDMSLRALVEHAWSPEGVKCGCRSCIEIRAAFPDPDALIAEDETTVNPFAENDPSPEERARRATEFYDGHYAPTLRTCVAGEIENAAKRAYQRGYRAAMEKK